MQKYVKYLINLQVNKKILLLKECRPRVRGKKWVEPAQTIATMLRKKSPRLFDGSRVL